MKHSDRLARVSSSAKLFSIFMVASLCTQAAGQVQVRMASSSMSPTLTYGEQLQVNVTAYTASRPARWDIVTFRVRNGNYVLNYRVVGLPGDTVTYDSNKLLSINGVAATLAQTDLSLPSEVEGEQAFIESWHGERHWIKIRKGAPVVMLQAIESFVDRDKCSYTQEGFNCVVPADKYFVMGDNRDSSNDSRYRGFISIENILGRVENSQATPGQR